MLFRSGWNKPHLTGTGAQSGMISGQCLKQGYDVFEREREVPRVRVADKSYVVN